LGVVEGEVEGEVEEEVEVLEELLEELLELLEGRLLVMGAVDFAVIGVEVLLRHVLISAGTGNILSTSGSRASNWVASRDLVFSGLDLYAFESLSLHRTHTAAVRSSSGTNIQAASRVL